MQGLAAHERQFSTTRGIDNLGVRAGVVLLDHAVQDVEGQADAIEREGIAVGVPGVGVAAIT